MLCKIYQNLVYNTKSIIFVTVITIPCKTIKKKKPITKNGIAKGDSFFLQPQTSNRPRYSRKLLGFPLDRCVSQWLEVSHGPHLVSQSLRPARIRGTRTWNKDEKRTALPKRFDMVVHFEGHLFSASRQIYTSLVCFISTISRIFTCLSELA